jgi:hypothetical protein
MFYLYESSELGVTHRLSLVLTLRLLVRQYLSASTVMYGKPINFCNTGKIYIL